MSSKIYNSQNINPPQTSPDPKDETIRILANLKQRFSTEDNGRRLVSSIYYTKKPRHGRNPQIPLSSLSQYFDEKCITLKDNLNRMAELLRKRGINSIMHYQLESWCRILKASKRLENTRCFIISAPTGFGKTESFLIPIIEEIMQNDSLAILVYPRRELIKDQLARILRLYPIIENIYQKPIKIGLQFEGIKEKLAWTIGNGQKPKHYSKGFWDLKESRVDWINNNMWRFRKYNDKLISENILFEISMINIDKDFAQLKLIDKCPICRGGKLGIEIWYKTNRQGKRIDFFRDSNNPQELNPEYSTMKCNNCNHTFEISLAKEHHLKKNINLLLTTLESLEILISNPEFRKFIRERLKFIVFDEIHVYHGMYGNHVSHVIGRIKELAKDDVVFIGASATIDNPEDFAKKLFQVPLVISIEPYEEDRTDIINGKRLYEHYYFIKVPGDIYELSTYIQTAMFLGHSFIPDGKRVLFFFDSRDLVYRATKQLIDAETNKELWKFRIECPNIAYANTKCPGYHRECYISCPIYREGECWYAYSRDVLNLYPRSTGLREDEDISAVTAYTRTYTKDSKAKIINTTSVLELGIDDEKIVSVGQYKAPHTVYSFIQRIGRAGRTLDTDTHIFVILGNDVSDLFYYRRADKITSEEFKLPLNPENPIIKEMHSDLKVILNRILQSYKMVSRPSYIDKIACTWKVMTEGISTRQKRVGLCPCFVAFLQEVLNIDLKSKRYDVYKSMAKSENRDRYKELIEKAIDDRLRVIEQIVQEYGKNPAVLISEIGGMLEALEKNLSQEEKFRQARDIIQSINGKISRGEKFDNEALKKVFLIIAELEYDYANDNNIKQKLEKVRECLIRLKDRNVSVDISEINKLRYEIAALRQLYNPEAQFPEGAIVSKSPLRIIKYLLRSQYFFCKACTYNDNKCREEARREGWKKLRYFIPMAYFEEPQTIVVEIEKMDNQARTILASITDVLFSYIPYKINIESNKTFYTVVPPEIKVISKKDDIVEVEIGRYFEGIHRYINGEIKIEPRTIHAKEFPLDDYGIGIVKYCDTCHTYYPKDTSSCSICGSRLKTVRLYSSPIINRTFESTSEKKEVIFENEDFKLYIANITAILELNGIEAKVIPLRWDPSTQTYQPIYRGQRTIKGNLKYPLSTLLETRGLILHLSNNYISSLLQREILYDEDLHILLERRLKEETNPQKRKEIQNKIRILQNNKIKLEEFLQRYKQDSPEEIVAHTIAHLLTIVVSAVTGVNPEDLWYGWKKEDDGIKIAVWEKFEGGAGIVETYRDTRRDKPLRILEELTQTVNCPVHKAERLFLSFLLTNDEPRNIFNQEAEKYEHSEFETLNSTEPEIRKKVFKKYFEKVYIDIKQTKEAINQVSEEINIDINSVKENAPMCFDGCPHCIGVTYCIAGKNEQYDMISLRVAKEFIKDVIRKTRDEMEVLDLLNRGGVIAEFRNGEYTILLI